MSDLQFGPFTLSPVARQLRRGEDVVSLPAKAFDLLALMAQNPGRPLTKKELLRAVWADTHVEESNLSQGISVLRKALGADGEGMVVTLPGVGYQFAGSVTEVQPTQGLPQPLSIRTTESLMMMEEVTEEGIRWWTSPLALTFAGIGLILLGVAGWLGWERYEDRVGGPPVQVVVSQADGTTGDEVLDRTLVNVMRIQLAQSPFVSLVPSATVRAKLVQMERKPEEALTVALAREVCERTGSQAVIHGSTARAGRDYLLTEEAVNCADGTTIGETTRSVGRPEELPRAIAAMAGDLRHSLGESRRTIARFRSPLYAVNTNSLEALKDFSEGFRLFNLGKYAEATGPLKEAAALDPHFATAWMDLATIAFNDRNRSLGTEYMQKAYDARAYGTEPDRLYIVARYTSEVDGDLYEGIRNYKSWIELYPRMPQPWSGLGTASRDLGHNAEMLVGARKALELAPTYSVTYYAVADAQIRNRDFEGARATAVAAISRGLDGDYLRSVLLRLGYLQGDRAYIAQQEAWAGQHPDAMFTLANEALLALQHGKVAEAMKLLGETRALMEHSGQQDFEAALVSGVVSYLVELGETGRARRLMATVGPQASPGYEYLGASIDLKEGAAVPARLAERLKQQPHSTLWNEWYAPILRGRLLMAEKKPGDALAALEPTRVFDGKDFDAIYVRGLAYMQLGQLAPAEAEFRKIVAHPELNPAGTEVYLAQVQLARVLVTEGRKQAAAEAYQVFLTGWDHADDSQPLLLQVRKEFGFLTNGK